MIPMVDRKRLLDLARRAIVAHVRRERPPAPPDDLRLAASGVFVTIYHRQALRGCLGTLDPAVAVSEAVVRLGADVTHRDNRFAPLRTFELDEITIDVSVLTEPMRVDHPSEIVIGRDGLIVEQHGRRGLLLPQVAPEHGFDRDTFLAHTCLKAGLAADAWMTGASIYRFEAEVFGEADFLS
jgi:AmmeMemoRadiSam system protein A